MGSDPEKPLTDKEIDARREAGLKKLLATPPKPHKAGKQTSKKESPKPKS